MTTNLKLVSSVFCSIFAAWIFVGSSASAQTDKHIENPDIILFVDGLACPFCAYGIEKRLKKVDGVEKLSVLLEEGKIEIAIADGRKVAEADLATAVRKAGFEVRKISFLNEGKREEAPSGR